MYRVSIELEKHGWKFRSGTMAVDQARFPLVSDEEVSEINTSKTAISENITRAT